MDDDGELGGAGDFHLADEDIFLDVARGVVVVIVEADFSAGDDFGGAGELFELGEVGVGGFGGFVGMDAGGGVNERDTGRRV